MAVAFEGVCVVPMDSERVLDRQTVLIEGDRISWIGPEAEAQVPAGAQRIAGRGKYLMPGLADLHSHPYLQDDLLLLVAHGVTTIRNLHGMPRHVQWRQRVAAGDLLGPTIFTAGPIVDGRPVRSNGNLSVVTQEEAVAAVELTRRGGYDCVKVYDQLTPDAYGWITAAARERELPVVGHIPFRVGLAGALAAGQRSIEHLYGYPHALQPASRPPAAPRDLGQLRAALFDLAQHAELDRIAELAEATRAAGTWNCATLIVRTRWLPGYEQLSALPELRYLSPAQAAEARYFFRHYPTEPERFAVVEFNAAVLRGLNEAGAGLLAGTDAGVPGIVYGVSLHEELRAFVDAGLTPFDAISAATTGPAAFLGQAGQWGEVTVGARADLLLVDGNPLTDVSNTANQSGVMLRGRWLPQPELADLLADLAARRQGATPHRVRAVAERPARRTGDALGFQVTWAGHDLGQENIVSQGQPEGGRLISATAVNQAAGLEAGSYREEVTVDAAGVDGSAWFEYEGEDGFDRVEVTRAAGSVHVRHEQAGGGEVERTIADPAATALFGRPLTPLFVRLTGRLTGLEIGGELEVPVIAPGVAPDLSVDTATLHAVRLPPVKPEDPERRYLVEFHRPNWTTSALLTCDVDNAPLRIDLSTDMSYWHNNSETDQPDDESVVRVTRVPGAAR